MNTVDLIPTLADAELINFIELEGIHLFLIDMIDVDQEIAFIIVENSAGKTCLLTVAVGCQANKAIVLTVYFYPFKGITSGEWSLDRRNACSDLFPARKPQVAQVSLSEKRQKPSSRRLY